MKFLADENFNGHLYAALKVRLPQGALTRVQDVGLSSADDGRVLQRAATNGYVILTHDRRTFTEFAYARVARGESMPGVVQVRQGLPIPLLVDQIEIICVCSLDGEWTTLSYSSRCEL